MTNKISESTIEKFAVELLEKQGYQYIYAPDIAPDSKTPGRQSFEDVLPLDLVRHSLFLKNPGKRIKKQVLSPYTEIDIDFLN